jgi:class 3 adenylate cyclase
LSHAAVNYRPRIIGFFLFSLMLLSIPGEDDFRARVAMAGFCLLWPHIAYWIARKRGGDARAERTNILVESFIGGVLAVTFSLRLWPTIATYAIGIINLLLFGGPRFLLVGLAVSGLGVAAAWLVIGPDVHLDAEPVATGLSIAAILAYIAVVGTTAYRLRLRQRDTRLALEREEHKSQKLLSNVFPTAVVPRLRAGESPIADQFADVTVVFVDIVEFTPLAERLGPKRTVLLLNDLFGRFDQAAARLGVEKIETTGDGYLAVAGAPEPLDDHPAAVAEFALEAAAAARITHISATEHVEVRVGVHTGPVFGGVIGESRFHYKIFGETVNTASRIQAQSRPGRILVSENTYKRLQGTYALEEHATLDLKGHGPMRAYWLLSRYSEA